MALDPQHQRAFHKLINPEESEILRHARCGESDGNKEIPSPTASEPSDHERQILYEAKSEWIRYESAIEQRRAALTGHTAELRSRLAQASALGDSDLRDAHNKDLELLDQQHGHLSTEFRLAEEEYTAAREEKVKIEQLVARPLDVNHAELYVPVLIALAIAEVPVNRLAFELFFESMPLVSLLLSAAIGGIFIFFAHTIGSMVRRLQCKEVAINRDEVFLTVTLISLLAFILMYFLGLMREMWVDVSEAGSLNLEAYLSGLDKSPKSLADHLLIGSKGFTLLLLNLAIFAMGVVTAFRRHDPHPNYEKAVNFARKQEQRFVNYKKRFEAKRNEIIRSHNQRLSDRESALKRLEEELRSTEHELVTLPEKLKSDRTALVSALTRRFMAYQNANKRARSAPDPVYFADNPKPLIESLL